MSDDELQRHILERLKTIDERVCQLLVEVATLRVKAGIWGVIGGVATTAVAIGAWTLKSALSGP